MNILDEPQFKVLRRLSAEQLKRMNVRNAWLKSPYTCPLALALHVPVGGAGAVASALTTRDLNGSPSTWEEWVELFNEGDDFIVWWDDGPSRPNRTHLATAKRAALAEKAGAS